MHEKLSVGGKEIKISCECSGNLKNISWLSNKGAGTELILTSCSYYLRPSKRLLVMQFQFHELHEMRSL